VMLCVVELHSADVEFDWSLGIYYSASLLCRSRVRATPVHTALAQGAQGFC
jgi:hypothetical protein